MKLYTVWADTYNASYGCEISLFGVYNSRELAEKAIQKLDKSLIYTIEELNLNETKEIYLGGYYE